MSYRHFAIPHRFSLACCFVLLAFQFPVEAASNLTLRVLAANLTSGNNQRYETAGLNILKGLKPDIAAIQEFNVSNQFGINTSAAINNMVAMTFGTNFSYFRESGYGIPNGIISRWPLLAAGSWDDPQLSDRGFAWAQIDLPGTNDLYVVSVHLHSSGGASSRATEAAVLKALIATNLPANSWFIVAGDFNTDARTETAVNTFKTFLSDDPVPTDQAGDADTNANRNRPYDYLLVSFTLTNALMPVVIGTNHFTNGLVFDSRVYSPLSDVPPVQSTDSGAFQMQHMGVVKDLNLTVSVPPPAAPMLSQPALAGVAFTFTLTGTTGTSYVIQASANLAASNWVSLQTNAAPFSFTESNAAAFPQRYYRAIWQP